MKLIFFLIAFCLVSISFYFSWSGKNGEKRGESAGNMIISGDHFYEKIKYSGKFQFNEDETGFKSISPGGYFQYRKNDASVEVKNNLQGEIEYRINDEKENLHPDENGKKIVAEAVRELIEWGYDADKRMERVYQRGGAAALLKEVDSLKTDQSKVLYLSRLFTADSLSPEIFRFTVKKIQSISSDMDKAQFLNKISPDRLKDTSIANAYFEIVDSIYSDMDKAGALQHILEKEPLSKEIVIKILNSSRYLNSDIDKTSLYNKMIDRNLITGDCFDSLEVLIPRMNSEMDITSLYRNLIKGTNISETQWITLLEKISLLSSDMDKSNLLIEFSRRMPKSEAIKSAYLKACKSIINDSDYGKAVRAVG